MKRSPKMGAARAVIGALAVAVFGLAVGCGGGGKDNPASGDWSLDKRLVLEDGYVWFAEIGGGIGVAYLFKGDGGWNTSSNLFGMWPSYEYMFEEFSVDDEYPFIWQTSGK
jgi:hypothetical protein